MSELTNLPRYDVQVNYSGDNVLVSESEYGYEQRRKKHSFDRRNFSFVFSVRKTWEKDQIEDFYKARDGAAESFTWTDPISEEEITMRIVPGSFRIVPMNKGLTPYWSITFQTVETR